jgi:hypothetical protein
MILGKMVTLLEMNSQLETAPQQLSRESYVDFKPLQYQIPIKF